MVQPTPKALAALYEADETAWLEQTAEFVRAGRFDQLDPGTLAEYLTDMAKRDRREVVSRLVVVLKHLLKWDHQPERRSRSWSGTIATQRIELEDVLADNPGLKPRIDDAITRAYRRARVEAANETELNLKTFPESCPYSFEDITSRPFPFE